MTGSFIISLKLVPHSIRELLCQFYQWENWTLGDFYQSDYRQKTWQTLKLENWGKLHKEVNYKGMGKIWRTQQNVVQHPRASNSGSSVHPHTCRCNKRMVTQTTGSRCTERAAGQQWRPLVAPMVTTPGKTKGGTTVASLSFPALGYCPSTHWPNQWEAQGVGSLCFGLTVCDP